jgi:hypothetical protein
MENRTRLCHEYPRRRKQISSEHQEHAEVCLHLATPQAITGFSADNIIGNTTDGCLSANIPFGSDLILRIFPGPDMISTSSRARNVQPGRVDLHRCRP